MSLKAIRISSTGALFEIFYGTSGGISSKDSSALLRTDIEPTLNPRLPGNNVMEELVLHTPTHPDDFAVEFSPEEYSSSLKSLKAYTAGEVMAYVKGTTRGAKTYTSVQRGIGADDHIELNSDLVYINHSCEPNAAFDLSSSDQSEWHLRALKDIHHGDYLTFFYPSSEWDMAQPFRCRCDEPTCLGTIQGAKYLSEVVLFAKGYVSPWILQLVRERDAKAAEATFHIVPQIVQVEA